MVPVIVVLLIIGCMLILASFIFDSSFSRQPRAVWTEDDIERLVERRFNEVKYRLEDAAEQSADQIKDQTERELEKLSNEKIMAVNEFSDQIMDRINKNHNEVMFLYGMINDKQKELDQAVERLSNTRRRVENEEKLNQVKDKAVNKEKPKSVKQVVKRQSMQNPTTAKAERKQDANEPKEEKKSAPNIVESMESQKVPFKLQQEEKYAKKERIIQMSEEGMSSAQIAKQLNLGIGEVRLVLELSKGRKREG